MMSSSVKVLLALCVCNVLLVLAEESENGSDDQDKEKLYNELFKILYDRKMNNEKEEFRNEVNKIIDEEEDINKFFSCAEISQSCNPLKHCCGNYQCSGMFGKCTDCVKQGQKCYRDSQCCPGYKCLNKFLNGKCGVGKIAARS